MEWWLLASMTLNAVLVVDILVQRWLIQRLAAEIKRLYTVIGNETMRRR